MSGAASHSTWPARRVVLLGASNLTHSLATVIALARHRLAQPLDVLVAAGHGRSYGMPSSVLWRELPGIVPSALWRELAVRPPAATAALVTDIGNDLLYEAPVDRVAGWVETCLERLARAGAQTVLTLLPTAHLPELSPWQFYLFRTLFVPTCRLRAGELIDRALRLNEALEDLAAGYGATLVTPAREWYGLDPIHVRRTRRVAAWAEITAAWDSRPAGPDGAAAGMILKGAIEGRCGAVDRTPQQAMRRGAAALDDGNDRAARCDETMRVASSSGTRQPVESTTARLDRAAVRLGLPRRLRPFERRCCRRYQRSEQPCGRLSDGTLLSLY